MSLKLTFHHWRVQIQNPATRRRLGFTLIELLVVIAIISVLVAILLPALAGAKRKSLRTKCATNLREVGRAWQMYCDDFDGVYPQAVNMNLNFGGKQGAIPPFRGRKPLNKYASLELVVDEGAEVFHCPSDAGGSDEFEGPYFDYYGTSYGANLLFIGPNQVPIDPGNPCVDVYDQLNNRIRNGVSSTRVGDASRVVLVGDAGWVDHWNYDIMRKVDWHGEKCRSNIVFVDGHVDFVKIRKGINVDDKYVVIPCADLLGAAAACQVEVPCE